MLMPCAGVMSQPDMTDYRTIDDGGRLLREHGTRKSRELAGWKACATPECGRAGRARNPDMIELLREMRASRHSGWRVARARFRLLEAGLKPSTEKVITQKHTKTHKYTTFSKLFLSSSASGVLNPTGANRGSMGTSAFPFGESGCIWDRYQGYRSLVAQPRLISWQPFRLDGGGGFRLRFDPVRRVGSVQPIAKTQIKAAERLVNTG